MLAVPNTVVGADDWFVFGVTDLVKTCDDRAYKVGAKPVTEKLVHYVLYKCGVQSINLSKLTSFRKAR